MRDTERERYCDRHKERDTNVIVQYTQLLLTDGQAVQYSKAYIEIERQRRTDRDRRIRKKECATALYPIILDSQI